MLRSSFRWLRLLSRRERSGVSVWGHQSVRHHQTEDQRVVSRRPIRSHSSRFWRRYLKLNGEERRRERVPPALRGCLDVNMKWTEESDVELSLKKGRKKKNKEQNKICSLSAVVVCQQTWWALCFLSGLRSEVLHCSRSVCWRERLLSIEKHLKSFN